MIEVKNLFYRQGNFNLNIPYKQFPEKGIILLTGSSGSGKSTFLNVLSGLLKCPSLVWNFKGQNLASLKPSQRGINYCFQDLRLFPVMTVKENIFFVLKAKKISFKQKEKDFEEIVDILNLKSCLNRSLEKLSGGEKQRTALARTLISPCEILFLDEPFSYLDERNQERARFLVKSYVKKHSLPLFLVSHEKEKDVSSQILFNKGCIVNNLKNLS